MGDLSQIFLQISQIIYLQMENFVVAILYVVYFAIKFMYFDYLWVQKFPKMKMQIVCNLHFLKFMNMVIGGNPVKIL